MEGSSFLLISFILFVTFWYRWRKKRFLYFKDLGIPGPTPNFIDGNMTEISEKGIGKCQVEWTNKYGGICGYFLGSKPVLSVSDPELLKLVMVKEHHNFLDREWFLDDGGIPVAAFRRGALAIVNGSKWKEIREIVSPTFTSRKIKEMIPLIQRTVEEFMHNIEAKGKLGEPISMNGLYQRLAFDATIRTSFGVEPNTMDEKCAFLMDVSKLLSAGFEDLIVYLSICLQEFSPIFMIFREISDRISYYMGKPSCLGAFLTCKKVLKSREGVSNSNRKDFMELLLEARRYGRQLLGGKNNQVTPSKRISNEEVVANMINFAMAGFDTMSSTLAFATYEIVKHPEIQEKLRREIQELNDEKQERIIYGIPYLDQVLSETLRKYSIVPILTNRKSGKEFHYQTLRIPKGLTIQASVTSLHNDPEFWTNPERFEPERFSKDSKLTLNPGAYIAFGMGPRNCVGMRFAQVVMRETLVQLLTNYELQHCDETKPLVIGHELAVLRPCSDLIIRVLPITT